MKRSRLAETSGESLMFDGMYESQSGGTPELDICGDADALTQAFESNWRLT